MTSVTSSSLKKFAVMTGAVVGIITFGSVAGFYLPRVFSAIKNAQETDASANMAVTAAKVTFYSASWCGFCDQTRTYLNEKKIPFREIDVEKTEKGQKLFAAQKTDGAVPYLVIGDRAIRGFKPKAIEEAVAALR